MAGSKRKSNSSWRSSPAKRSKLKSAKSRFKLRKASKKGGYKFASRRKYLLKNRKSLSGSYQPRTLGGGKDYFKPLNEQSNTCVVDKQIRPVWKPPSALNNQQLVMQRKQVHLLESAPNRQAMLDINHMSSGPYINAMATTPASAGNEIPHLFNIAAYTLIDGGTYRGTTSGGVIPESDMRKQALYVKSHRSSFTITNVMNSSIKLSIYVIRHRTDTVGTQNGVLTQWLNAAALEDNEDAVLNLSNIGFGAYNSENIATKPGVRPYSSKQWNKKFGLCQHRHVVLDAGKVYNHITHVKYNKTMEFSDVYPIVNDGTEIASTNVMTHLNHWTISTMFVVHGQQGITSYLDGVTFVPTGAICMSKISIFQEEVTKFYVLPTRSQRIFLRDDVFDRNINQSVNVVQDEDGDIVTADDADAPL